MQLGLNQATFRRSVQLYLATLIVGLVIIALEYAAGPWLAFSDRFDALVVEIFGPTRFDDTMLVPGLCLLAGVTIWMLASSIGLLWYKRWARFGIWASTIAIYGSLMIVDGYRPTYSSPALDVFTTLDGMLLGAIVLMAYAKGYGADWFAPMPANRQE